MKTKLFFFFLSLSFIQKANDELDEALHEKSRFAIIDRMRDWMVFCDCY